ncbi:wd40 repeat domain-containing protein [Trypanosoma brucei equiperdum]|uniref:Wd40 repeat domain-containing protein n=1 Tax=Trypanosoma brucei equiperdum TaxID=630700 RepID=A0A3L6LFG7_9TRYP|nr:wd40 repeat domain-containing protein [Trypanosoma brucei equiperdum]
MFAPPECTIEGELPLKCESPFSSVYRDPQGAVWTVDSTSTRVFRFPRVVVCPNSTPGHSSPAPKGSDELDQPYFDCSEENDRVLSVVFTTVRDDERFFVCIATAGGCIAFGVADSFEGDIRRVQLGVELTALAAAPCTDGASAKDCDDGNEDLLETTSLCNSGYGGGVLVSSFDGTFSEVMLLCWVSDSCAADLPQRDSDVDVVGLFRVQGRVCGLMVDEVGDRVVTVTQRGDVDVWNLRANVDETHTFGMPAYLASEYGEPCCSILLGGYQLWIGTSKGFVIVFFLQPLGNVVSNDNSPCISHTKCNVDESKGSRGAPHRVWHAHGATAVRSLLVMSLGRLVWSYGADQQANVWDTTELLLRGSLQFPCGDLSELCCGGQYLDTSVWGVCSGSGKLTQFRVKELLFGGSRGLAAALCGPTSNEQMERCNVLGSFVSYLCSLLNPTSEQPHASSTMITAATDESNCSYGLSLNGDGDTDTDKYETDTLCLPPHMEVVVKQMEQCYPASHLLPHAVTSLVKGQRIVSQLTANERRGSATFLDGLRHLQRQHQQDSYDLKALRLQVEEERKKRQDAEARLAERENETHEYQQRLERLTVLQEECEKRTATLERQLKSAKKAAAVTSAEATRLCEMEANLHEAHCTVQGLQERMESLVRERQEYLRVSQENKSLRAQVRRFELKQQVAKRALANFIATQDHIVDSLGNILLVDEGGDHRRAHADIDNLYEWLCRNIENQQEFLAGLKRSYETQAGGVAEDRIGQ